MKTKLLKSLLVLVILFMDFSSVYALMVETHQAINESVAKGTMNGFSLDNYLKNNLGISGGVSEYFKDTDQNNNRVYDWIKLGGEYEDVPHWYLMYLRSKNHFHNPINEQGFSGIWDTGFLSGMSATQWALLPQNTQSPGGYYSWYDVRNYYLKALTSIDSNTRSLNFAETFRGVGQLMHLIQDMSVPEHTRNDGHYVPYIAYEDWVKNNPQAVNTAASSSIFFGGVINNITSFMDTNQYNGSNPNDTANLTTDSNGKQYSNIGLSEFSNANFFSDDSIFTGFTYPSIAGASQWVDTTVNRKYLKKTTEGYPVEHLAAVSWLYLYRWQKFPQYNEWLPLGLDSKVYQDYASLLLPRAVGYSASLINYFFRGQMNMEKDPNNGSQYVIKNETNEYMSGTFTLYYDDASGNRRKISDWNKTINANSSSDSVSITEPTDAKEKGKYILVFQGTLGTETGAVVGRVVKLEAKGRVLYLTSNPNYIAVTDGNRTTPGFDLRTVLSQGESSTGIARFDRSDWNTFVIATSKFNGTFTQSGYAVFRQIANNATYFDVSGNCIGGEIPPRTWSLGGAAGLPPGEWLPYPIPDYYYDLYHYGVGYYVFNPDAIIKGWCGSGSIGEGGIVRLSSSSTVVGRHNVPLVYKYGTWGLYTSEIPPCESSVSVSGNTLSMSICSYDAPPDYVITSTSSINIKIYLHKFRIDNTFTISSVR